MEGISSTIPIHALQTTFDSPAEALQRRLTALEPQSGETNSEVQEQFAEFAALLVFQMLQTMRRTVPKSDLLNTGFAHDLYVSLFDQEVARNITRKGDIGLASLLQQQFEARRGISQAPQRTNRGLEVYRQQSLQSSAPFIVPVEGQLSSPFGQRQDPFDQVEKWHDGIDIAAPAGSLIWAAAPGQVIFSGHKHNYGNLLILEHQDGYQTSYAHNAVNLVPVGKQVQKGEPIARVGETGRSTGPHVHFELRRQGQVLDPVPLLTGGLTSEK